MSAETYSITSRHFCCNECGAPVALTTTPAEEMVYECQDARCGKTVSVDCPEALRLVEALPPLPVSRLRLPVTGARCMRLTRPPFTSRRA